MDPGWFEFSSIFNLAFVEGMLLDMGAGLDTRKEHQATQELWEVSEPTQGCSFSWLSVSNTIYLIGSLLGPTTTPYLRQKSFMCLSWKGLGPNDQHG